MANLFCSLGILLAVGGVVANDYFPQGNDGRAIQCAIDLAAANGGGRVVVRPGTYPCKTIYLKSRVELHLEKGAVLLGSDKWFEYDDVDDPRILKSPEKSKKAFLTAICCDDVAITGGGTIDGQGVAFYDTNVMPGKMFKKPQHPRTRMLQFFCCRGVRLEGVLLKDSPGWTCWMRRCDNVSVSKLRIEGDQRMINNDGLHFDGCSHVRVSDSFFRTGDDSIVVRANPDVEGHSSLSEDVCVSNCCLDSACSGIRIGCPSDGTIRNVLVSDCVFRGNSGILSYNPLRYLHRGNRGRLELSDIRFERCDVDVRGHPLTLVVEPGIRLKAFGHLMIADSCLKGGKALRLVGNAETVLTDVRLVNCRIETGSVSPILVEHVEGLVQERVTFSSGGPEQKPFCWKWDSDSWECVP